MKVKSVHCYSMEYGEKEREIKQKTKNRKRGFVVAHILHI